MVKPYFANLSINATASNRARLQNNVACQQTSTQLYATQLCASSTLPAWVLCTQWIFARRSHRKQSRQDNLCNQTHEKAHRRRQRWRSVSCQCTHKYQKHSLDCLHSSSTHQVNPQRVTNHIRHYTPSQCSSTVLQIP
jgi:hypothetical protein